MTSKLVTLAFHSFFVFSAPVLAPPGMLELNPVLPTACESSIASAGLGRLYVSTHPVHPRLLACLTPRFTHTSLPPLIFYRLSLGPYHMLFASLHRLLTCALPLLLAWPRPLPVQAQNGATVGVVFAPPPAPLPHSVRDRGLLGSLCAHMSQPLTSSRRTLPVRPRFAPSPAALYRVIQNSPVCSCYMRPRLSPHTRSSNPVPVICALASRSPSSFAISPIVYMRPSRRHQLPQFSLSSTYFTQFVSHPREPSIHFRCRLLSRARLLRWSVTRHTCGCSSVRIFYRRSPAPLFSVRRFPSFVAPDLPYDPC